MNQIIDNVFLATVKSYKKILNRYYPSHGSNGFTERNLTFNFSHNYLVKNSDAIIWQECPLKNGKHFDTLIIDNKKRAIIVVEAKRLQNEKKLISIFNDYKRINECFEEITLDEEKLSYSKYGLLLIDVWISKKKETDDKRFKLLNELDLVAQSIKLINIDYSKYKEKYHLAYKLFPIDK